jgi:GTP cyclohydrolase I
MKPTREDALGAVKTILSYIGEDPTREGLIDTPERVVKSWDKLYGGYGQDIKKITKAKFQTDGYDQMIVLKNIEFWSTCEHHILPFYGRASIGYLPNEKGKVIGISKLARVVEVFSRRLQIQERLASDVAAAVEDVTDALGVGVVVSAKHLCMVARGVEKQQSDMVTSSMRGLFRNELATRQEFMNLIAE